MGQIAVVFPYPSPGMNDTSLLREFDPDYTCDFYYYSNVEKPAGSKLNKRDKTLDLDEILKKYKVIITIDTEVTKYVAGLSGGPQKFNAYAHNQNNNWGGTNIFVCTYNLRRTKVLPLLKKKIDAAFNTARAAIESIEAGTPIKETFEKDYKILTSSNDLYDALISCRDNKCLILDIETSHLYPHEGHILGIGIGWKHHMGYYTPIEFWSEREIVLLTELIYDASILTTCHNITFEMKWLAYHFDIDPLRWANYHDTMFLHYIFDENSPSDLKTLAVKYTDLGNYEDQLDEEKKVLARKLKVKLKEFSYAFLPLDILGPYACKDIDATAQVLKKFYSYSKKYSTIYNNLIYCAPAIAILELAGGPVDPDRVKVAIEKYDDVLAELSDALFSAPEVKALVSAQGKVFNPNSVPQVRRLLYEIAGLPVIKHVNPKDPKSAPSTDAEVLEEFAETFPIAEKLLQYRKATKFKGTYLVNILSKMSKDSRLRTGFNMARTTSGRLSSSGNINYQNIPRGKIVKSLFKARPGYKILQMDLGTAEVWVATAESDDKFFKQVFESGMDFHGYVAKTAFKLPCAPNEVAEFYKDKRQAAKAITFGILYGAQAEKIASEIGCSKSEAQQLINKYFGVAPQLKRWIDSCKDHIQKNGWIKSKFGRTRRVPGVFSTHSAVKFHAINSAFNFVVQSSASDINMLAFSRMMRNELAKAWMADQIMIPWNLVHDSIIIEAKEEYIDQLIQIMATEFQYICKTEYPNMPRPIKLDFELGPSWGEVTKYTTISEWI